MALKHNISFLRVDFTLRLFHFIPSISLCWSVYMDTGERRKRTGIYWGIERNKKCDFF